MTYAVYNKYEKPLIYLAQYYRYKANSIIYYATPNWTPDTSHNIKLQWKHGNVIYLLKDYLENE